MKGRIAKFKGYNNAGFILGEDGKEYFLHGSEVVNCQTVKADNIVEFDYVSEDGKDRPRAVNVRKTGHGKHHPFISKLNQMAEVIKVAKMDEVDRSYLLKDISTMTNYFKEIEDFEWCRSPNVFRGGER